MGIKTVTSPENVQESSLGGQVAQTISMPLKAFSKSEKYVNEQHAGQAALAWTAVAFVGGEAFGHKRARDGKEALVPFLRG
jgi:hypothetical protein